MPRSTHRQVAALFAVFAWTLGAMVLPALHLRHHQDDHVHLPNGGIAYRLPAQQPPPVHGPHGKSPPLPFEHGKNALAHLGGVFITPPVTAVVDAAVPVEARLETLPPPAFLRSSLHLLSLSARAPPTA